MIHTSCKQGAEPAHVAVPLNRKHPVLPQQRSSPICTNPEVWKFRARLHAFWVMRTFRWVRSFSETFWFPEGCEAPGISSRSSKQLQWWELRYCHLAAPAKYAPFDFTAQVRFLPIRVLHVIQITYLIVCSSAASHQGESHPDFTNYCCKFLWREAQTLIPKIGETHYALRALQKDQYFAICKTQIQRNLRKLEKLRETTFVWECWVIVLIHSLSSSWLCPSRSQFCSSAEKP